MHDHFPCLPKQRAQAFSLVEILVVLSIIAVLSGMLVAGAMGLQRSTNVVRTETIIETLRQAIELTASERGSPVIPAEHPLAGSKGSIDAPRILFQRSQTNGGAMLDGLNARTAEAIRGVDLDEVPIAYRDRVLLGDDYHADPSIPTLFGLRRERIGYLGANLAGINHYHLLPRPHGGAHSPEAMETLIASGRYLVTSQDSDTANAMLIDYVLGSTTAKTELSKLNSRSHLNELDALYVGAGEGSYIAYGRVWNPQNQQTNQWQPGHMRDPADGQWKRYRIRGLALYDAWGNEILYSLSNSGVIRLMSAGPSGVFAIHPGQNGVIDSTANSGNPSADDEGGAGDNIILVTDHG